MISPVTWTLREVCTVQPLCRSIRFIGAGDCATASASRNENRKNNRLIRVISIKFAVDGSVEGQANRHLHLKDTKGYHYRITGRAFYRRRGSEQAVSCRIGLANSVLRSCAVFTGKMRLRASPR